MRYLAFLEIFGFSSSKMSEKSISATLKSFDLFWVKIAREGHKMIIFFGIFSKCAFFSQGAR